MTQKLQNITLACTAVFVGADLNVERVHVWRPIFTNETPCAHPDSLLILILDFKEFCGMPK